MLRDSVLERGMAEGGAVEVEGRFNTSTGIAMWLKGAFVEVGLDAASVDVLCMVLDLDYDKAISTNQLQHWRKVFKAKSGETTPPALVLRRQDQSLPPLKMLPRVADLIIRETPVKLKRRFEELAGVMSGRSLADSSPTRTMTDLMLAHEKVS